MFASRSNPTTCNLCLPKIIRSQLVLRITSCNANKQILASSKRRQLQSEHVPHIMFFLRSWIWDPSFSTLKAVRDVFFLQSRKFATHLNSHCTWLWSLVLLAICRFLVANWMDGLGGGSTLQLPKKIVKMTCLFTSRCFCSGENVTISLMNRFWDKVNMGPTKRLQACTSGPFMRSNHFYESGTCKCHPNVRFEWIFVNW